jgi:hypothetical protein
MRKITRLCSVASLMSMCPFRIMYEKPPCLEYFTIMIHGPWVRRSTLFSPPDGDKAMTRLQFQPLGEQTKQNEAWPLFIYMDLQRS